MYYGARHLTTKNKAIKSPADLKGMLIRAPDQPVYLEAVKAMGAYPDARSLSPTFIWPSSRCVVDGQEKPHSHYLHL